MSTTISSTMYSTVLYSDIFYCTEYVWLQTIGASESAPPMPVHDATSLHDPLWWTVATTAATITTELVLDLHPSTRPSSVHVLGPSLALQISRFSLRLSFLILVSCFVSLYFHPFTSSSSVCAFIPPIPTNHYQTLPNSGSPKPRSPGSPPPSPKGSSLSLSSFLFSFSSLSCHHFRRCLAACLLLGFCSLPSLSLFFIWPQFH